MHNHKWFLHRSVYISLFRTRPTLTRKQKRGLQDVSDYVQNVVKNKKVRCRCICTMMIDFYSHYYHYTNTSIHTHIQPLHWMSFSYVRWLLQQTLYGEYLRQSVADQDLWRTTLSLNCFYVEQAAIKCFIFPRSIVCASGLRKVVWLHQLGCFLQWLVLTALLVAEVWGCFWTSVHTNTIF